jgi:hypothetical protein
MKTLPESRPVLLWAGLLLNITPISLGYLDLLPLNQVITLVEYSWFPSIVIMLASFEWGMILLLLFMKVMALGMGQKFIPFYVWTKAPAVTSMVMLAFAFAIIVGSYLLPRFYERYTQP